MMIEDFNLGSRWAISTTFTNDPSMRTDEVQHEMELDFKTFVVLAEVREREGVM